MDKKIILFTQLLEIKRYSSRSIETYVSAFRQFLNHFNGIDVDSMAEKQIEKFINLQVTERKISISYQKQLVAAIKFWYNEVLGLKLKLDYLYPDRSEFKIPVVFSQQEIKTILLGHRNIKTTMIYTHLTDFTKRKIKSPLDNL